LKNGPKGVVINGSEEKDIEASIFRNQIMRVLSEAGFDVRQPVRIGMMFSVGGSIAIGLLVRVRDTNNLPPHAETILDALKKAGHMPNAFELDPRLPSTSVSQALAASAQR